MFSIPPSPAAASFQVGARPIHPPEVVGQADQLIEFCQSLRAIQVPEFNGDHVAQAASIRLWMESSEEIQNLERLDLSGTFLAYLPPEIGLFRSLKNLNCSYNQLTTLPAEIGNLRALRYLNVLKNQLKTFPAEIVNLIELRHLIASDNLFEIFPAEISFLRELESLYLASNRLKEIPAEISSLRGLKYLDVSKNQLESLPVEIGNLIELQNLDASNNLFEIFPAEISFLRELESLYLSGNQLKEIPSEIGQLGKLIRLNISGNQLETLPVEIGNLSQLIQFDGSKNRLESLPAEIGKLGNLEGLQLEQNGLETLPAEIGNLGKLEKLNLSTNRFKIFPVEIFYIANLQWLEISCNQLETLPSKIDNLTELEVLDVSKNRLESLPPEIGNLRKLVRLDLSHNRLETLPAEMGNFQNLKILELSHNQLVALPIEMRKLVTLDRVFLEHNRFQPLVNQLARWSSAFEHAFFQYGAPLPKSWKSRERYHILLLQILFLNDEHHTLSSYLQRLEDLVRSLEQNDARKNVILRVERMIQLAGRNVEFGHIMLAQISDGLEACGDRVLLTFNEIEIQWQFHHKELDDAEFKSLAIRAGRYELLKQHAIKVAVAKGLGDHVETILGFHLGLRDDLDLPITMTEMLYQGASGVTPQMLGSARAILEGYTDEQVLAHSEHWKSRMTQKYPAQAEEVDVKYGRWCEVAEQYFQFRELAKILAESGDYNAAMKAIAAKRSEALAGLGIVNPAAAAER